MILDKRGKAVPQSGAGFVKTAPVNPKPPKGEKFTPADCVGFTVGCDYYYPLVDCKK